MNKKGFQLNWNFVAMLIITMVLIFIAIKAITGFGDKSYTILDKLKILLGL